MNRDVQFVVSIYSIEYRPGRQHGNADGLSRCPNPRDCQCPSDSSDQILKCGPCNKCKKRAIDMQSDLYSDSRVGESDPEGYSSPPEISQSPINLIDNCNHTNDPIDGGGSNVTVRRTLGLTHTQHF